MLRILRHTLFTLFFITGASLAVFAQNTPPKEPGPKVPVKPKETPKPTPKKPSSQLSADLQTIIIFKS